MSGQLKEGFMYVDRYRQLVDEFEHVSALLRQLGAGSYSDFSIYLNNLKHLEARQLAMTDICGNDGFREWLKQQDIELWCNIMATGLSYRMVDNLIANLRNILEREKQLRQ